VWVVKSFVLTTSRRDYDTAPTVPKRLSLQGDVSSEETATDEPPSGGVNEQSEQTDSEPRD
jgi:hypothetical protein